LKNFSALGDRDTLPAGNALPYLVLCIDATGYHTRDAATIVLPQTGMPDATCFLIA
jgi:hypothetical protein